jgi:NADP-dependent 3-hydroxy acid dehydrogenase YdfG
MEKFNNQTVLITGASSGFGAATALRFAAAGAELLLGARRVDRLEEVARQALERGARAVHFAHLDVSQTESVAGFFEKFSQTLHNGLHVLVNNAGGAHGFDPVETATDADWEAMMQSNVLGVLKMSRAGIPYLKKARGSSLINIGSVAGRGVYEGGAAYCAAKAGELQITRALRLELNGTGIRVCTIDPGLAETEFSMVRFKGDADKSKKVYQGIEPLTAADIAETIFWVASRPSHVCIDELVIKPTDQAAFHKVHRRS